MANGLRSGPHGRRRRLCRLLFVIVVALWAFSVGRIYASSGLFVWVGVDFRHYYAQAMALRLGEVDLVYSREATARYGQSLAVYSLPPDSVFPGDLVPYPPVFPALLVPFTLPPPPIGLLLWTGLNLVAAAWLTWRVASLFEPRRRCWAVLAVAATFSVGYALVLGQAMLLLGCAFAEWYLALRAGKDFRSGLWLSILLCKPQYGILIGPLLLWKGRWRAVAGVATGGAAMLVVSVALVGLPVLLALPAAILDQAEAVGVEINTAHPEDMVNWRKLVRYLTLEWGGLGPWLGEEQGIALTVALSVVAALAALAAWRGPWAPADRDFPTRMAVLVLATVLASFHSHAYGPVLLLMPTAALLSEHLVSRPTSRLLVATAVVPTLLWVVLFRWYIAAFTILLVASFGALLYELWSRDRRGVATSSVRGSGQHLPLAEAG